MRIGIIQFPGSNCERETMQAVLRAGMTPVSYLWNEPREKLLDLDGYVIVGGFSYEDRSRSGIIAALDPVMELLKIQNDNKKPILGICNGAQILVEAGFVPGLPEGNEKIALTHNKRIVQDKILGTGYYNAWVHLKLSDGCVANAFTRDLHSTTYLHVPVAHAEGRFLIPPMLLKKMQAAGLIVLQYCNAQGQIIDTFPTNPNGSVNNIAAICNPAGNVLAIMPHPERTPQGDGIFLSMRDYIRKEKQSLPISKNAVTVASLPSVKPIPFTPQGNELIIGQIITDNHAFTVENTLRKMNIPVRITRHTHWEIRSSSKETLHRLKASGVLYNDQKEFPVTLKKDRTQRSFLIRAKEDLVGLQKRQQACNNAAESFLSGIEDIQYGILWHIHAEDQLLDSAVNDILQSGILFNPLSQECYHYV